ncbi:MAG: ferric reductase-like transmembrane domain-containing protein, partial [Gammaproteobacteria bacterium]
ISTALLLLVPLISTRLWFSFGGVARDVREILAIHRVISYLALFYLIIHIGGSLVVDLTVVEYLKPSAPWGMVAALVASVLLLATIIQSELRIKFNLGYKAWRIYHAVMSFLIFAGVFYHIVEASYFTYSSSAKLVLGVLSLISGLFIFSYSRDYKPMAFGDTSLTLREIPAWRVVSYATMFATVVLFLYVIPRSGNRDELQVLQCLIGVC